LQFLKDNGLLFEMNRAVLHPLGLTLQLDADGKAELLQTDDPAGMVFTADTFQEGESRMLDYMIREGSSKLASRKAFLQYVEQTDPDQGDSVPPPDGSGSVG
jgi:hypothetical protein